MKNRVYSYLLQNIPVKKGRGWTLKLIWKTFHKFEEINDISEIWNIYKELKSRNFQPHQRVEKKVSKKALKMKIKGLSQKQFQRLEELSNSSKNLYNQALYIMSLINWTAK